MPDAQPLKPGDPDAVGGYRLTGRLGAGGQGVVYLGEGPEGRPVAVKLLHAHLDDDARRRFVQELAATKRVARFCTAQVLDADLDGDRPFIISEYVEGRSLAAAVEAEGVLADGALERLATGTLTALAAIHQAGVVHRDFKPGNVLLGPDGPRVIDFGIAKALDGTAMATQPSAVIGTPAYMAPEQVSGGAIGRPADVWAWAATLVFAATGVPPFGLDGGLTVVLGRILHADPNLGSMSGPLRDLVQDALAKDPEARPSAQGLLLRLLGGPELPAAASQAPPTALLELGEDRAVPDRTAVLPPVPWSEPAAAAAPPFAPGPFDTQAARPSSSGFRPGVAAATAALVVALFGGGAFLMSQAMGDDDPEPRPSGPVATAPAEPDEGRDDGPEPPRDSTAPQPKESRPSDDPPPGQAGVLHCTETTPYHLNPADTSGGLGFDAAGGPLSWTASSSGAGSVSPSSGRLEAGGHAYVALHLTAADLSVAGSSTLAVEGAGTSCSRTITWDARPVTDPDPGTDPAPTDTATPEPPVTPPPGEGVPEEEDGADE